MTQVPRRGAGALRPAALLTAAALALSACGGEPEGVLDVPYTFSGAVVAEEPQAATIAREVLLKGGSAADAVVAGAFAMTATLPSRVGLMGGGACVVFDGGSRTGDSLVFRAEQGASGGMIPGFVRGLDALHARYGFLRWPQLVASGEALARFGGKTSRAFARDAAQARQLLAGDPTLASIFLGPDGQPPREGEPVEQVALSVTLGQVRQNGLTAVYRGDFPEQLAAASRPLGQPLTAAEIRGYKVGYSAPLSVDFTEGTAFFAPPPAIGGLEGAQLAYLLTEEQDLADEEGAAALHLLAEAAQNVILARDGWRAPNGGAKVPIGPQLDEDRMDALLAGYNPQRHQRPAGSGGLLAPGGERPDTPASASLIAVDYRGQAVACSFSLGRLFGSGRLDPETGLLFATPENDSAQVLSPVVVGSENSGKVLFLGAAAGGMAAQQSLIRVMIQTFEEEGGLRRFIEQPRAAHNGYPDAVFAERILDQGVRSALEQRGHRVEVVPQIGALSAIYCPEGLAQPQLCQVEADQRGFGLPARAD
ncbi:MAG: gamma-glutamyltransferase [Limibacillus sp.]|jgi:gamma-glutamyltranspeptidase/glutathione hydrolase